MFTCQKHRCWPNFSNNVIVGFSADATYFKSRLKKKTGAGAKAGEAWEKKSQAGAEAAKKFAGSPALFRNHPNNNLEEHKLIDSKIIMNAENKES